MKDKIIKRITKLLYNLDTDTLKAIEVTVSNMIKRREADGRKTSKNH